MASGGTSRRRVNGERNVRWDTRGDCRMVCGPRVAFLGGSERHDIRQQRLGYFTHPKRNVQVYLEVGVIDAVVHDAAFVVRFFEQPDHRPGRHIRVQSSGPYLLRLKVHHRTNTKKRSIVGIYSGVRRSATDDGVDRHGSAETAAAAAAAAAAASKPKYTQRRCSTHSLTSGFTVAMKWPKTSSITVGGLPG